MPDLPSPDLLGLPHPSWREGQSALVEAVVDSPTRFVAVAAPTGVGKSVVGVVAGILEGQPTAILTATKGLQDQYTSTFGEAIVYDQRGMGNYPCREAVGAGQFAGLFKGRQHVGCDEGPCRIGKRCDRKKAGCEYFDRVRGAMDAGIVSTSYAYWVSQLRYNLPRTDDDDRPLPHLSRRGVLVLDEAHDAPDQVADQLTVTLSKYDIGLPPQSSVRSHDEWRRWAGDRLAELKRRPVPSKVRAAIQQKELGESLRVVAGLSDDWAIDRQSQKVVFAPIVVGKEDVEKFLLAGIPKVVLLSATLTRGTLSALHIDEKDVTWLEPPSPFPVARRPVVLLRHYLDAARPLRIDHRTTPEMEGRWVELMDDIIEGRRDRKGIIHTVSYARQMTILKRSRWARWMIVPRKAGELKGAVQRFREAWPGAILVSPSVVTGFDFPGQECEYQIISKVPFPDTRSPVARARADRDPDYRIRHALVKMTQAIGRGMRLATDQCETFVVDDHAWWVVRRYGERLMSRWVRDAIRWETMIPPPPPRLG